MLLYFKKLKQSLCGILIPIAFVLTKQIIKHIIITAVKTNTIENAYDTFYDY